MLEGSCSGCHFELIEGLEGLGSGGDCLESGERMPDGICLLLRYAEMRDVKLRYVLEENDR